ncbi:hypothetical protein D3C81_1890200 [compost metagenome]
MVSAAWRSGSQVNLMNSRQAAALGVPARMAQLSRPQMFWSQTMPTGALELRADCARETQTGTMSTSPDTSNCSTCAPLVQNTETSFLILSSAENARSRSQG